PKITTIMNTKNLNLPLALAGVAATLVGCGAATEQVQQPNIVMLFVDDMGWADMGYRTAEYQTPNLDKLAAEGIDYTRAYVPTATSSPSRAALLTGKESLRCGFVRHIYDNPDREEFQSFERDPGNMLSRGWLPLEEITFAERLKEEGYYNYFVGKWHLGHEPYYPICQGFDEMYGTCEHGHPASYYPQYFKSENPFPDAAEDDYLTDLISEGAESFIKNYDRDEPFLLNVWYYAVHGPRVANKEYLQKYLDAGLTREKAVYASMLETLDNSVGRIREALKESGFDDNTIIIFTSDQGGALQNGHLSGGKLGGNTLGEGGTRVPFIVYYPEASALATKYDKPISTIDIYPTFVELATGEPCTDIQIQGVSLTPTFEGEELAERDIFLHRSYEDQNSAIINGDWKLIKYRSGKLELFNIKNDESEKQNLVEREPQLTQEMLSRLNRWQNEATPSYLMQ
ncbi:MAG: sulfatase, partial [Rikenellaceae bacterium]